MAPEPMFLLDDKGKIINVSKGARLMLNYDKRKDLIGKAFQQLGQNLDFHQIEKIQKNIKISLNIDFFLKNEEDIIKTVANCRTLKDDGKTVSLIICKQIKELKTLKEIYEERKKLDETHQAIWNIMDAISHDLLTPSTAILTHVNSLSFEIYDNLSDDQKFYLDQSKKNLNRLIILVKDLMEFSKLETEKYSFKKVHLYEIIDNALSPCLERGKELKTSDGKKKKFKIYYCLKKPGDFDDKIEFDKIDYEKLVELKQKFPNIYCDKEKMTRVITNLIFNSMRYSGDNTNPNIQIGFEYLSENNIRFFIKDDGLGIAKKDYRKIFEPFYQVHSLETKKIQDKGAGLGLTTVKRILEKHKFHIFVESKIGNGSEFYFNASIAK